MDKRFDFGIPRIDYPSILKAHSGYCTTKRNISCCIANASFPAETYTSNQTRVFPANTEMGKIHRRRDIEKEGNLHAPETIGL
ncbi:Poly(A)-specific ribonuclease PARN-like domain-containing protein 1 [Temnothorax longispinosus]|uniref:Poly(A)-specific ribonuclease PARN-like domain-containing protein 1 n=1 Tax=Temnothorax longispinosus TaxID=300112 RepID=A0A4S2KRB4_9HYME|nr:Poly(A)-specific ribonuclease PARN-like domain-containing protein 1 [Temnothorax longispinosus]